MIIFAAIMIVIVGSASAFILTKPRSNSPMSLDNIRFSGEALLRKGDLVFTFKPTVIHNLGGDVIDFRLTATNVGDKNNTFIFGDDEPTIEIYSAGVRVSALANSSINWLTEYGYELRPGQSQTVGWTWSSGSVGTLPAAPGNYSVSAEWFSLKTLGVPMQVLYLAHGNYYEFSVGSVADLILMVLIVVSVLFLIWVQLPRKAVSKPVYRPVAQRE